LNRDRPELLHYPADRTKAVGADHFMDRLEEWLRANKVLAKPPG